MQKIVTYLAPKPWNKVNPILVELTKLEKLPELDEGVTITRTKDAPKKKTLPKK